MKCPGCDHCILEEKAKFCSQCGTKLSAQPTNTHESKDQPKSLVADSESTAERSAAEAVAPSEVQSEPSTSPKRKNDECTNPTTKKSKKRKKNKQKNKVSSDTKVEESVDSLQESLSSIESQPCSSAVNDPVVPFEDKHIALSENNAATVATIGSVETPDRSNEAETGGPKSTQDQTPQIPTSETATQESMQEERANTVQPNPSKKSNTIIDTEPKNDSNKGDRGDQNENVEPEANGAETRQRKKKGTNEPGQQNKVSPAAEHNPSQVNSRGPSGDPKDAKVPMEVKVSGESSNADKDCQGDAAVDQSADAIQKTLSLSETKHGSFNEDTTQPGPGKKSNQQDMSSKNKEDTGKNNPPRLDQNVNVEPQDKAKQSRKKGKSEQDQQQKEIPAPKQKMVFGPQKMAETGNSSKEPMKVQKSDQSSRADKESQKGSLERSNIAQPRRSSNEKDQTEESGNSKNKVGTAKTREPSLNRNGKVEVEARQTRQTSQRNKEQGQQQTPAPVFGPQKAPTADSSGSSVDPVEPMDVEEAAESSHAGRKGQEVGQERSNVPPPKRLTSNQNIAARDRLTIYFHAVLSKDFKFNPNEDRIFVLAGRIIGSWDSVAVELSVTRDLGKHGFLVQGHLAASKKETESKSISYKYVVYRNDKGKYDYEFIYKTDTEHIVNRCLFVKPHLLNDEGDWHQYDDIICTQPSTNVLKRFQSMFFSEQNKLIEGRKIAGRIMLQGIFDLLREWTAINLTNFWTQLRQFFEIYGVPFVYEEKQKKWDSLDFGKDDVKTMLKEIMLHELLPQLLKTEEGQMVYTDDPVKAAVIMLSVCKEYAIRLSDSENFNLCRQLCLSDMKKEEFTKYWTDFLQDVAFLRNLKFKLASLIKDVKTIGNPRWFMVLPLFHLLNGTTKPFEMPTHQNQKTVLAWAGFAGLEFHTASLNMNSQDRRALMNIIKNHSHLIEIDPILLRSCLYLIPLDELLECNLKVNIELLDMLQAVLHKTPDDIYISTVQELSGILSHIQGKLIEEKYSCFTETYRNSCLQTAMKLLTKICKAIKRPSYSQNFHEVPVACINMLASVLDFVYNNKQQENAEGELAKQCTKELIHIVRDWLSQYFYQTFNYNFWSPSLLKKEEIETWNNIIAIQFKDENCTKQWRQTFTQDFEGQYKKASPVDQIEFYCKIIEDLHESHPYVAASIENCALAAVPLLCQSKSEERFFANFKINWKFDKLISAFMEKSWPRDDQGNPQEDEDAVLQHLLSSGAARNILKLYDAAENATSKLSNVAIDRIKTAIEAFTTIKRKLVQGDIEIKLLNAIFKQSDAFLELLQIDCLSENAQFKNRAKMERLIQWRRGEVKAVYREKELFDVLVAMSCKLEEYMEVDLADMRERQQINIEVNPLDAFMEVHPFDWMASDLAGIVTYFKLDQDIRKMAVVLHTFQDSRLFSACWEKEAQLVAEEMGEEPIKATLEMIHKDIFTPVYEEYKEIYTYLKDGHITLAQIDELFGVYKGKYEELALQLHIMCEVEKGSDTNWIHQRVQQIEQYHELHLAAASAKIIMTVKETLCLQGDFKALETLVEATHADFQKEHLNRIDNDLMTAKKVLVDITEPRRLCLKELGLRKNFVNWVKDALEDINELKVFVDLATISAGENDMDLDRVACFHDAVLGYSSMLYELKPESGFDLFNMLLKKLWNALDNDSNLTKKLRDSARHLEWLKSVKDSHGSVELSSLSLASAINERGIYLIKAPSEKRLCLDSVLKLQIPDKHDDGLQMRSYSLEDLRELQNKLMLMSGKGDQGQKEVDDFAEVFDHVQRLSEAFISLFTAGNPLFTNWNVQINCCSTSTKQNIFMSFNLENVNDVVLEGNIGELLLHLCRKMETCFKFWMDFVEKQRWKYYYLNYYTAEQMVFLCTQLTQQNASIVDEQVLMMLSFVKPNCTASDLRQARHELQYDLLTKSEEHNEHIEFQTFVVQEGDMEDLDSSDHNARTSCVESNGSQEFELIWNDYIRDMKNFLPHILDIKSFGRLLEILANTDTEEGTSDHEMENLIGRELPKGLVAGAPNLIVCPHDEVLLSCISIYMSSEDEPLPTYDEVLLCTSSTPYEQVELFLRRCLSTGYRGQKLYSLLYGDSLSYDVSLKVESFFQQMKMQSRKDYRLVVICSSEREHTYLPSAFSQYRLHMVPQRSLSDIQGYLHKHFVASENQPSAASAFKDRLCVGVISSTRAGVGKTLYIKRLNEKLRSSTEMSSTMNCIRLMEPSVDESAVLQSLLNTHQNDRGNDCLVIFHFDITSSVQRGINEFLFKLLILRYLMDSEGKMWKCSDGQLYLIEILRPAIPSVRTPLQQDQAVKYTFIDVFPNIFCRPPKEVLMLEMSKQEDPTFASKDDPLMDEEEFRNEAFQRPYQYLKRYYNRSNLDAFKYQGVEGSHVECLQMLLMYCGVTDPSWAELRNFAWFLNYQLQDCESSVFCDSDFTGEVLAGFKTFVVDFMILMAKDFATPSLSISDQSPGRLQMDMTGVREEDLAPFLLRKRWETQPHPYIFFNDDHVSMTFIGFHLRPNSQNSVDAIDPSTGEVIKKNVMTIALYEGLKLQRVPFNIDFDSLPRGEKIERLCNVLGIQWPLDPDETYELTTDNILKMLAIHMRFRCGIPVIIMGETGCGKTRLIKFLCELRRSGVSTENMKLVKVHGGTTSDMIYSKVREAEDMALINKQDYDFDSVLFFDEANTTEAISSIKEVLCDNTLRGEALSPDSGLQIVAACNPYRKHTEKMIQRLEAAGLGYRVQAEDTEEKLGSIPLRQLVYRVQALPPSMIPLVWDFGQLNDRSELIYIEQIVQRVSKNKAVSPNYITVITKVLSASQKYMREQKDECSFVSLRDVERCMQAFAWFYDNHSRFFRALEEYEREQNVQNQAGNQRWRNERDPVMWSLIMAIGVCYHACLEHKENYRNTVSKCLPQSYTSAVVKQEISLMQDLLLSGVPMGDTIAKNSALKENVFMMVLCIELRIPLFLVGKPGSSKSLSKTLVADAMQGQAAHSALFKKLKQIHLVSFQCSPHSTPEGIINTFKQCGRFQEGKNLDEYISVVVLDEIGLAEDSPKMPLKTLHPLLEEGCIDDDPLPHKKVGFIGISNWALDPAKMNRGIFVSRGDPDNRELIESAKGICSSDAVVLEKVRDFFPPLAKAYLKICVKEGQGFFGLRDYYSLIKMIFAAAKSSQQKPSTAEIVKAVLRNFCGKEDIDTVSVFAEALNVTPNLENLNVIEFVRENIHAIGQEEECRYLLLLTKNYAALQILQQSFFSENNLPEIIFGSSFPKDQEYTQICRNINRVKICMETGRTVVLLNLQNLYESLYDALNQYYVFLGGQKYVDLGLGTHRVKCRVHKDFRLIVIEERDVVYKEFPIPLINRLEKHYLDINTVLTAEQKRMVGELEKWVTLFVSFKSEVPHAGQMYKYKPADVFIGYHSDTCASVILQVIEKQHDSADVSEWEGKVLEEAKLTLLKCATPDSIVRLRGTSLAKVESDHLVEVYYGKQNCNCLADFILTQTTQEANCNSTFTEVTTFSRLLTASEIEPLEKMVHSVELLSLQQFDTEHSFLKKIRNFLAVGDGSPEIGTCDKVLIIQSDFDKASHSANLIASAKYSSINEINKVAMQNTEMKVFVYFITRLPRMEGGTSYVGFHGGPWRAAHIDDLRQSKDIVSDVSVLQSMTISQMFETRNTQHEAMEVDDIYTEEEEKEAEEEENLSLDKGSCELVDTTALMRSCVQSAVAKLRDQVDSGLRSTRRVEILLTLLTDHDEIKGEFVQTLKRRLHLLLSTQDGNLHAVNNWVIKEAANIDALQEGGTFRHTLWKRVQAVVVPFLAHLLSVIDRDQNLDLLLDDSCGHSVKRLWLDIFGNDKLLEVLQPKADHTNDTKTILVQNYIVQNKSMRCCMPFSWRIKNFLEELLVHALHQEGLSQQKFDGFFLKTPLGRYIEKADLEMRTEFFQRYLQDFIYMTMNVTSQEDLQLLCRALSCCVGELRMQLNAMDTVISLPWIHAAYSKFKIRLQNLSRMICIEPQVVQHLCENHHSRVGDELVLDVYAALVCVEYLEPTNLNTDVQRQNWLWLVKKLQVPIELICSEDSVKDYGEMSKMIVRRVQTGWNRISALSLFVENLLLGIEKVQETLTPLVLGHTRRLAQILEKNSDLKSQEAFEEVITLLRSCKDGAVENLFRFGLHICPVCMGDPQDPVGLPCEHVYCLVCIKEWLSPGQMYCPLCIQEVDEAFQVRPSEDLRISISQHSQFRKRCNAFFIDLVSSMCFKDNSPPNSNIILHLLSFLMVEVKSVLVSKEGKGTQQTLTKMLSPFDDSVDKNPVVRSVVLKLLLKYSFDKVKKYLQQHLSSVEQSNILEKTDKTELYLLYINCLEDSMYERVQFRNTTEQQVFLLEESAFLVDYEQSQSAETTTVEYLQQVARVRMDLDLAADLVVENRKVAAERTEENERGTKVFLDSVVNLCERTRNDWYRVYLIRKISSQHGVDSVLKLLKENEMCWLFPEEVLLKSEDVSPVDQYLVCGEHYKTIRDAVAKAVLEGQAGELEKTCEGCACSPQQKTVYLLLALHREVTTLYRDASTRFHPKPDLLETLKTYIQASGILTQPPLKDFAQALVTNELGLLAARPGAPAAQYVLVDLTIHLVAVLLCGSKGILAPLQELAMHPDNMQRAFLPTMADDMLAVAQQALGNLHWYRCPNGHHCTVGECGQPMEKSKCIDCGAEIGGVNHRPVDRFQAVQVQGDRTQTGHILGDPNRRDNADMLDTKGISPVAFTTMRMFTHMAMLRGAERHLQHISAIINPRVPDVGAFLFAHLQKDLNHLIRSLGKGTDDTVSAVNLLISSLMAPDQQKRWPDENDLLPTKEVRNQWEVDVSNDIITLKLKHLDRELKKINAFIRADSRISANPVMKLLFGDPRLFLALLPHTSLIHSTSLWSCREKASLLSLTHYVEQNDGRDNLPVLWRFLNKEAELRLVKHLPDILMLQRNLVKMFQNVTDVPFKTIDDFLCSQKTESLEHWYKNHITMFLTTWNQLRVSLDTNGEIKIPAEYCRKDLDFKSDFMVLLPRRRGPGLCSTALVSYLIALHNELVYCMEKHSGEETSYKVSPSDLTDLHVIRYELERDLMPLILANSQYSIEKGKETLHEYDLPKIQQQIMARFFLGKPLITLNGIPTLVNRHDRNYEIILRDIKAKVPQEPLQTLILSVVAGELHSYSEVCDALSTLEVALGFLAMTGGEPHVQLSRYLEEVLQMGSQMVPHILKTLSTCCLMHCVALWQLLKSLKSENILRLKRDPFVGVSDLYKVALGEKEERLLTGFFSKSRGDGFKLEIHEFLVLKLKKHDAPDTFNPNWGLKDTLVSYMESKDLDVPPDVETLFPEEILLSHCVETWKFIVAFKQERHRH